jgi:threonine aldolase
MKSYWENYKGKKIFFARYDHLSIEQVRTEVVDVEREMLKSPPASVLLLVETTGTIISPEALNLFKNVALKSNKQIIKSAILGMTGARMAIMDIVVKFSGLKVSAFGTEEKAKDWLVQS